jgi:hypothetical protein
LRGGRARLPIGHIEVWRGGYFSREDGKIAKAMANGKAPYSVMLSSTYKELVDHRRAVREAMLTQRLLPVAMEDDAALPDQDLIGASLLKVDEADAYVGLISYRYGQTPQNAEKNPNQLSLTELEFRHAVARKIPICMFIMHEDHPVPRRAIWEERGLEEKFTAFLALAKKDRIFAEFKSVEDLKTKTVLSLIELRRVLEQPGTNDTKTRLPFPSKPIASIEEITLAYDKTDRSRWPCPGASVSDLNLALVRAFASKVAPQIVGGAANDETLPARLGLLSAIPAVGQFVPHNSAILCFSDSPERFLPQARASFVAGDEDTHEFVLEQVSGSLHRQINTLVQLTLGVLRTRASFDRPGPRAEVTEIPRDVIREAISNAVSHRDYKAMGTVQVRVRKDSVEITNPGSFPPDFSWDAFLDSDGASSPNDAFIAYFLTIQLAFEGIGRGFRIFREYIKQNGKDAISFERCPGPATRVRIRRPQKFESTLGEAAAITNVPIRIPAQFLGRDSELAALDRALNERSGRAAITALHGLRGIGKTTLAAAYAERHSRDYRATWWIRAETISTIRADLVGLGVRLGWIMADEKEEPGLATVMQRLRGEGEGILLVYDNVTSAEEIRAYLPRGGNAHVIVTSNAPNWGGIASPVEIEVWPKEVGADYLIARTKRNEERQAALALSEALGGLPLAHEQAAAYCDWLGISLADYAKKFAATPGKFLDDARAAPAQYHNGLTVAKTFALAIDEATKLHPAAEPLISYAALLAPEPIPLYLFSEGREKFGEPLVSALADDGLDEAVAALRAFGLVDRETIADERDPSIETDCIRLHRLVRIVAAERWNEEKPGLALNREKALGNVVSALAITYPKDIRQSPRVWRLFPHIVRVLEILVKDYAESEAREFLDELTRLVVMALRFTEDRPRAGNLFPDYLATVIGDFYEVELLKKPIALLLEHHRDAWPGLQQQFLSTDNYALRYAMADALADAYRRDPPLVTMVELEAHVMDAKTVNEFELGGYALNLVYARDPDKIKPAILTRLVERREYCGRSILGDLLLNLAFRKDATLNLHDLVDSDRFWRPIWDFIKVDVRAIEAAELFMVSSRRDVPEDCLPETKHDFDSFKMIEADNVSFLQSASRGMRIVKILDGYFSLGEDTDSISEAEDDFANLSLPDMREIMRLLFAHPIWAVAEAAATMLSLLVAKDNKLIRIVGDLFENANWRVRYGACETAFILSRKYPEVFYDSVRRFYNDPNCKIRGLCAENLFSHVLNTSRDARQDRIREFEKEIHYWLADEDCWVLEHVFRVFHTLDRRHVDVEIFFPPKLSRLLAGAEKWYQLERGQFLLHIERRKEELVNS